MAQPLSQEAHAVGESNTESWILAIWRILFFGLMLSDSRSWYKLPLSSELPPGMEVAFAYDQFQWLSRWNLEGFECIDRVRSAFAFLAMLGCATPITAGCWAILQLALVCSSITNFVNHDYLFALLSMLTAVSGAGHCYSIDAWFNIFRRAPSDSLIVLLKAQFGILYLFAALWKIHPDWIDGYCVRCSFLKMEASHLSGSIPWRQFDELFGQPMWQVLSIGGLGLDAAMFMLTSLMRPRAPLLFGSHVLFHGFNACFLSGQIGYRFPFVCIASVMLFLPGQSCTVAQCVKKSPSGRFAKMLFIGWIAVHCGAITNAVRFIWRTRANQRRQPMELDNATAQCGQRS
jgi:hypothetical protein